LSQLSVDEQLKGVYVLIVRLRGDADINIGALGSQHFPKGLYWYVGSAQTALEKRISRHLRREKRKFWHIDYLLDNRAAEVEKILFKEAAKTEECTIADEMGQVNRAIVGFGCSDCSCKSHLFYIEQRDFIPKGMTEIETNKLNTLAVFGTPLTSGY